MNWRKFPRWPVLRSPLHYLAGIVMVLSYRVHWVFPVVLLACFLAYELTEWLRVKDEADLDIWEFVLAAFVTAGVLIVLS